jgi:hypothetical protein
MARTHSSIALDSAEALRNVVGPDATAGFESDPNFVGTDPASTASSENVAVQRDSDDTADSDEEEAEAEDLDEEDEDDELVDDEDEDDEDEDEDEDEDAEAEPLQAKTSDEGEEDDDAGDVESGLDEDALDDDELDTDRVTDAALGLEAVPHLDPVLRMAAAIRMAPSTSARSAPRR